MCIPYHGVNYYYAFEFNVSVPYKASNEKFRIVTSKYNEETYCFSGLCLENELTVISDEKIPFWAFVDIIDETVKITTSSIITYADAHDGRIPNPHRKVEDEIFINQFNEKKNSKESLYYNELLKKHYDKLRESLIELENPIKETYIKREPDFNDYLYMTFFRILLYSRFPNINVNDMKFFPI